MHREGTAPIASITKQDAIVYFECSCKNDTHGLDTLCSLEGGTSGEVRCYTQSTAGNVLSICFSCSDRAILV